MITMKQVMYPSEVTWTEYFFDGEAKVVNNVITFDREHWKDALYQRGFVDYITEEAVSQAPVEAVAEEVAPAPKRRGRPRKELNNG